MILGTFEAEELTDAQAARLAALGTAARGDILQMTTLAASGHPGGSMSSIDFELILWGFANCDPKNPFDPKRDRVVISHGHTSPAAYAALAHLGWFDRSLPLLGFRRGGSPFEGHVERDVPGIDWGTGNLGQGLSAAAGFALAARIKGDSSRVFCAMGDGEQQKGQLAEARRFAVKYGLTNLVAVLDWNHEQLSGSNDAILKQDIVADWKADGWGVIEVDGHDVRALYRAIRSALRAGKPTLVAAHTVMSKGVPFMEKDGFKWHGAALPVEKCHEALAILGAADELDRWIEERKKPAPDWHAALPHRPIESVVLPSAGSPRVYPLDKQTDNRSAFGNALADLGALSGAAVPGGMPLAVIDCDLSVSTKTETFEAKFPQAFFQCGIAEHHAAVLNGALSLSGVQSWWGEFAMFGVAETYNQQRLNDVNAANAKLAVTHAGIDVGEDGKTHHSIDYFGLLNSTFGWKVFTPADPNQTDRVVRWMATHRGNHALVMGRSKIPFALREDGTPIFAGDYAFDPTRADRIRTGGAGLALVCAGNVLPNTMEAWNALAKDGVRADLVSICAWSDLRDEDLAFIARHGLVVSVEDHNPKTGLGTLLQSRFNDLGLAARVRKLGVTFYSSSGPAKELYRLMGLDGPAIAAAAREELSKKGAGKS
ncbi:MAG TPA: transketolase [Thermoanaerobaculia bacterium]|nr:transketolase [Thermoanaerobaculia bacterium]